MVDLPARPQALDFPQTPYLGVVGLGVVVARDAIGEAHDPAVADVGLRGTPVVVVTGGVERVRRP